MNQRVYTNIVIKEEVKRYDKETNDGYYFQSKIRKMVLKIMRG